MGFTLASTGEETQCALSAPSYEQPQKPIVSYGAIRATVPVTGFPSGAQGSGEDQFTYRIKRSAMGIMGP